MSAPGGPSGGSHKQGSLLKANTKSEAKKEISRLPEMLQPKWKKFVDGTSNKYNFYLVAHDGQGGYVFKSVKPGNFPGSRAEYYKELDGFGKTTAVYKITYDNHGNFVHRKDKL
jgi:hypothetical protein